MIKKLIIVDDDTPFRERLGRSMEKKGFFVETFASYKDCLKRCDEENFDANIINGHGLYEYGSFRSSFFTIFHNIFFFNRSYFSYINSMYSYLFTSIVFILPKWTNTLHRKKVY